MKFQVISDLHLETRPGWVKPPRKAPYLFLAGDIGDPYSKKWQSFIEYCAETWDKVFYVTGNHEFYKNSMDDVIHHIESKFREINPVKLVLLQRGVMYPFEGYFIVGCTLWSDIKPVAFHSMNDATYIKKDGERITIEDYLLEYKKDSNWLKEVITKNESIKLIVLTHHCPSFKLMNPGFEHYGEVNTGFYSALDNIIKPQVKLWICGHTHKALETTIGSTQFIINPIGYERETTGFREEAFEILE